MNAKKVMYMMFGALGLVVAAGVGLYSLLGAQLEQYSAGIQTKQAKLSANERQLATTQQAAGKLKELNDVEQAIDKIIPAAKAQSDAVADVTALAAKSNVSVESISFASSTGEDNLGLSQTVDSELAGLRKLPVTVRGEGSYSELLNFIKRVENNQRKATIGSINISPQPSSNDYDANMVINFYVRTN